MQLQISAECLPTGNWSKLLNLHEPHFLICRLRPVDGDRALDTEPSMWEYQVVMLMCFLPWCLWGVD